MIAVAPPTPLHTTLTTFTNAADSEALARDPAGVEDTEMHSDSEEEKEDEDEFGEDEPTLTRDDEEDVAFDMDTVLKVMATQEYDWIEALSSSSEDRDSAAEVTDNEPAGYSSV
jgi:hypothetical protein